MPTFTEVLNRRKFLIDRYVIYIPIVTPCTRENEKKAVDDTFIDSTQPQHVDFKVNVEEFGGDDDDHTITPIQRINSRIENLKEDVENIPSNAMMEIEFYETHAWIEEPCDHCCQLAAASADDSDD